MDPTLYAVCGFSLLFLPPIIHVFLSFPVTAHILAWLPIVPFPGFFSACRLLHVFGNHFTGGLCCAPTTTTLSVRSSLPPVDLLYPFLLALCPAFSLSSTSFPLGTGQHIPLFHVPPTLPPLRSQRRWQPRCRMREGAPRPGSRSRPRSPAAL